MADVARTNSEKAELRSRFLSAGTFERAQTDSGWEFRPNEDTAHRVATFHSGCLTLIAFFVLEACGCVVWMCGVFVFARNLSKDWLVIIMLIGCGLTFIGSIPLLVAWARHVFRKSLRDNWQTMRISPGGPIEFGEKILVEAGRARHIDLQTVVETDSEGTSVLHSIYVVLDRESAASVNIPIPRYGSWDTSNSEKRTVQVFAEALASALGVVVCETGETRSTIRSE